MPTINTNKITKPSQVAALKDAGLITAAQAKSLLQGLQAPKTPKSTTSAQHKPAVEATAKAAVAPKADKIPKGFIEADASEIGFWQKSAFSHLKSASTTLASYLPFDADMPGMPNEALLRDIRAVAQGADNFMAKQQSIIEASHYSFPAQIWSHGNVGFHPRELEDRLSKVMKAHGLKLEDLPGVLREVAAQLPSASSASDSHSVRNRLAHAANSWERRNDDESFKLAKEFTPIFRMNGREGSWQLTLKPAKDGMWEIGTTLRPGTKAPADGAKPNDWMQAKVESMNYEQFDASLPATSSRPSAPATQAATVSSTSSRTAMSPDRALKLAEQLSRFVDMNMVPRNVSENDIKDAIATLKAGVADVERAAAGTRGTQTYWGGSLVSAQELKNHATHLGVLLGEIPSGTSRLSAERAMQIGQALAGVTDPNRVPRNISTDDVKQAAIRLSAGVSEVAEGVRGTRGNQTYWGGQLVSPQQVEAMAKELSRLGLRMEAAGI